MKRHVPPIFSIPVFIFLSLLHFQKASAQKSFLPGTVVLSTGDTLQGYILEITGRINPRSIEFKTNLASEAKTYPALDVNWFRFKGGEWYFSYIGPMESSSLNTNELTYDSDMHTFDDTLFIRAVILGKASLYYARDRNDRIHLFMQMKGSKVTELGYKKYYVDEIVVADYRNKITRRAVYENQMYKGQLIQAFRNCPYIATGITSKPLPYAKNEIEALFESYNRCKGTRIIYEEPKDNGKVVFTLNGGVNFSSIKFESVSYPPWNDYQFDNSIGFALGLSGDFLLPRTEGKWGFFNELSLKSFKADGNLSGEENVLKLDLLYLKIATMMRYYLTPDKKEVRPYVAFGIANNFAIKDVNVDYSKDPDGEPILDFFRTYEQGLIFGVGTYYQRFNAELRYEFSNGISGYTSLKSPAHTAYILVGYKLFEL